MTDVTNELRCPKCGHRLEPAMTPEILADHPNDHPLLRAWKQAKREKLKEAEEFYARRRKSHKWMPRH